MGVNRVTVTRWRLYSPHFQAALNERRQAIWAASLDRLRALVPLALDAVADELANADSPNRLKAAFGLLKLVPLGVVASGPTDPDEIVKRIVENERCSPPRPDGRLDGQPDGPPTDGRTRHQGVERVGRKSGRRSTQPHARHFGQVNPGGAPTAFPASARRLKQ